MDIRSKTTQLLRSDFSEEAAGDFPRLRRVPCTAVVKLLDYFDSLAPPQRQIFLDVLAHVGAARLSPSHEIERDDAKLGAAHPAYAEYRTAVQSERFSCGYRYIDVKMTRAMLRDPLSQAVMAEHRAKLSWPQRDDPPRTLAPDPDLSHLTSAKAPLLRKLVGNAFGGVFATEKKKLAGGETEYTGMLNGTPLTVRVDHGSMAAQLRYGVSIPVKDCGLLVSRLSAEDLWVPSVGWDYLTEQNAPAAIDLLCEQVVYLVALVNRITKL
jgi:hypothetical protein